MSEPWGREVGVGVARDPRLGRRRLEPTEGHQEQEAATDFRVLFGSSSSEEEEEEEEVRDGDEVRREDVRPVDRDAGPTSGPTLDAKGVALWEKGVLACPAERFGYAPAGIFPLDLKPRIQWSKRLRIPVAARQRAQSTLLACLAKRGAFEVLRGCLTSSSSYDDGDDGDDLGGRHKAAVERCLRDLARDRPWLEGVVKKAVEREEGLYQRIGVLGKGKEVYRNLLSALATRLRECPLLEEAAAEAAAEAAKPEPKPKRTPEPKPEGEDKPGSPGGEMGGESSESEMEIVVSERPRSLLEERRASEAKQRSLAEMRSRHNRRSAEGLRRQLEGDRGVFMELGKVLGRFGEAGGMPAREWADRIRRAQEHDRDMVDCGLDSDSSSSGSEEVEVGSPLSPSIRTPEATCEELVRSLVWRHVERGRVSRKEGDRIIERATDKVMSRHLGATSSSFVEKEKKSIAKLVAAYVEAAGRARRR